MWTLPRPHRHLLNKRNYFLLKNMKWIINSLAINAEPDDDSVLVVFCKEHFNMYFMNVNYRIWFQVSLTFVNKVPLTISIKFYWNLWTKSNWELAFVFR